MLVACSKDVVDEASGTSGNDGATANSLLQVTTRSSGANDATVSYPVQVYVFQGDECRAFKPSDAAFSTSSSNVKASTVLRPVAVVTLEK